MVLAQGITLWIDPDGGEDQEVGIRFPLGFRARRVDPAEADGRTLFESSEGLPRDRESRGGSSSLGDQADPIDLDFLLRIMLGSLDLIAGQDTIRVESGERGVDVAVKAVGGSLVYEVRRSLEEGAFLAAHAPNGIGRRIGLGLVSPRPERRERPLGRGGAFPEGERGEGLGRGPGRRSGPPSDMRGSIPSLDIWVSVAL